MIDKNNLLYMLAQLIQDGNIKISTYSNAHGYITTTIEINDTNNDNIIRYVSK